MDHKGHTILTSAKTDAAGKCCDASHIIHLTGITGVVYAGVMVGAFASQAEAKAAAPIKTQRWVDEQPAISLRP